MLLTHWSPFVTRTSRICGRPFLVNLGSLLQRIPFRPLEINCLYLLEYLGLPPQHAHLLRGPAEVRTATLEDLEGLTKCQNRPLAFLNRFRANDHCVVAVVDGRIVAYQWFCFRPFYTEERYAFELEVPPDAIYEYDVFILPEYRLAGIWFKFHCIYLKELMERLHRRRIIGMVDYGNRLAMSTHLRFGFRIFRRVFVIRLFGRSIFVGKTLRDVRRALPRWISSGDSSNGRVVGAPACPTPRA
jgi:GNAT superfamily N-acetyltransferase